MRGGSAGVVAERDMRGGPPPPLNGRSSRDGHDHYQNHRAGPGAHHLSERRGERERRDEGGSAAAAASLRKRSRVGDEAGFGERHADGKRPRR